MNKRKFLEKFVALSSVSLVVAGCATTHNSSRLGDIKSSKVSQQSRGNIKQHSSSPIKVVPKEDTPLAVYGPPPVY